MEKGTKESKAIGKGLIWGIRLVTSAAIILTCGGETRAQAITKSKLRKILVLDKSQGGANAHKESRADLNTALRKLAAENGFEVTIIGQSDPASKTSSEFSAASLAGYQVVLFSNNDGVDAQIDLTSKSNLETFVKNGGGLIPIHAASAYIGNWPWLTRSLVQSFYGPHGSNMPTADVAHDPDGLRDGSETKGIFKGLTAPLAFLDEYYAFRASPRGSQGVTILLTVDEKSYSKSIDNPMGNDHPVVWAKTEGQGRVVHMSMGHSWSTNNVYTAKNEYLTRFLFGILRYAAGDFIGCTDPADRNYNPDATKSDAAACAGVVSIGISAGARDGGNSLVRAGSGIDVVFGSGAAHAVDLMDLNGKVVDRRSGNGPARYSLSAPGRAGMYVVKARAGGEVRLERVTVL